MKTHLQNTSRRQFIKTTAAAAGATLAAPMISTRPLFGANAPSNTVQVAMIGCGNIGGNYHIPTLMRMDDVRVIAVADAYKSRREAQAAKLNAHYKESNLVKAYADFREILARPDIDAVFIGAHDNWHTPMAIAAAKAGKDVYCQKPLALDYSLTPELRKAVNDNNRVFQFGTQYRSGGKQGRYRIMVQLVRNGYIGKLTHIDVWCRDVSYDVGQYHVKPYGSDVEVPVPADLDFDAWMGPMQMVPYTVDRATCWGGYHCPETSLGFIAGCGVHELGLIQWAVTNDDTSPIHYEGTGHIPDRGIYRTLDRWDVNFEYANGVKVRYMDKRTADGVVSKYLGGLPKYDGTIFHGTEGWISVANGYQSSNQNIWRTEFKSTDEQLMISPEHNRNFIDCVKSRKPTICPVEMGIRCDVICHLSDIAVRTGRTINWDPKSEQIIGDAEANAMLRRPYRDQWKVW